MKRFISKLTVGLSLHRFTSKCLAIILLFLIPSAPSGAQNYHAIDSFKNEINKFDSRSKGTKYTIRDSAKAKLLIKIAQEYWDIRGDSNIYFSNQALSLSKQISFYQGEGNAYVSLGVGYENLNQLTSAFDCYKSSLLIFKKISYLSGVASAYNNMANLAFKDGDFAKANKLYDSCIEVNKYLNDTVNIAKSALSKAQIFTKFSEFALALTIVDQAILILSPNTSNEFDLGIAMSAKGDVFANWALSLKDPEVSDYSDSALLSFYIDSALKYYSISEKIFDKHFQQLFKAICIENMGDMYSIKGEKYFYKAMDLFQQSFEIYSKLNCSVQIASVYLNMGAGQMKNPLSYEEAKINLGKSFQIYDSIKNKNGIIKASLAIGRLLCYEKKFSEALTHTYTAYYESKRISDTLLIRECSFQLCHIYESLKEFDKAYSFLKEGNTLDRKIFSLNQNNQIKDELVRFEFEKLGREKEKAEIEKINEKNKKRFLILFWLVCGIVCIISLVVFVWPNFFNKIIRKVVEDNLKSQKQKYILRIISTAIHALTMMLLLLLFEAFQILFHPVGADLTNSIGLNLFILFFFAIVIHYCYKRLSIIIDKKIGLREYRNDILSGKDIDEEDKDENASQ